MENLVKINRVIQKFRLNLYLLRKNNIKETSAFIKYNFITNDRIQNILKYEPDFRSEVNDKLWIDTKNGYVSIFVPKKNIIPFPFSKIIQSDFYNDYLGILKIALGEEPNGEMVIGDLEHWVNVLIAGVPGSGKSNLLNVMINCFVQQSINDVRLVLIDLKQVELVRYNKIPHLLKSVITEVDQVEKELIHLISEMNRRYKSLEESNCRNIQQYRKKGYEMPYLVVIIDELAEIILVKKECENQIVRLAQKGRAAGIHLVIATQKPNAEIVTSLIKGSIDTRISFRVASHYDSQIILDQTGAERLGKHGDMLLRDEDGLLRLQCCYISDDEIEENLKQYEYRNINDFGKVDIKEHQEEILQLDYVEAEFVEIETKEESEFDRLYKNALELIMKENRCSAWLFMTELNIGRTKADKIISKLKKDGYISQYKTGKDYKILKEVS